MNDDLKTRIKELKEELVDKFSNTFAQMVFEQAGNIKRTIVEEDE